jgi:cell division protein FtsL
MKATSKPRPNRKVDEGEDQGAVQHARRGVAALAAALGRIGNGLRRARIRRRRRPPKPQVVAAPRQQEAPRRPRGFLLVWGVAVTIAAASFVLHLNVRFDIIRTGYTLSQAQGEQRRLRLDQRELRLELATLKAPGRIEQQAREGLGMMRPDPERIVRLGGRGARVALRRGR